MGKVYFVCDFKYGDKCILHYAYSMSKEVAENSLPKIQHKNVDIHSDFRVIERDEQYLTKLGKRAGINLDFNN